MDYRSVIDGAKDVQKTLKSRFSDKASEFRFFVQFKNGTVYQYKTNTEGMTKLYKINFEEVVMVQLAIGNSYKGRGRYAVFAPVAIAMIDYVGLYEVPAVLPTIDNEPFGWNAD